MLAGLLVPWCLWTWRDRAGDRSDRATAGDALDEPLLEDALAEPTIEDGAPFRRVVPGDRTASSSFLRTTIAPGLFLFALAAGPSAGDTLLNVQYWLFFAKEPCTPARLGVLGDAARLVASAAAGALAKFDGRGAVAAGAVAAALGDLAQAPLARFRPLGTSTGGRRKFLGLGRRDYAYASTGYAAAATAFLDVAATALALAAAAAAGPRRATTYGALLGAFDAGASVSGWVSADLVDARGIAYGDWGGVGWLVDVGVASSLAPLLLLPLVAAP